jgi:hypothetical protein
MSNDPLDALCASDPRCLASLMSPEPAGSQWQPQELSAVLLHQMRAPLSCALGENASTALREENTTFNDQIKEPHPRLELLEAIRASAKEIMSNAASGIPLEVAGVFYYGSIALARLRLNTRISNLDDNSLRQGIQHLAACPWLDDASRAVFTQAIALFDAR